ncbi:hypothetical protein RPALISO_149 [Ruegeria phage RpAliso]|nr:hypothetical protein RPALISO_149 [Ruegeria phage RpAliso]
MGDASDDLRKAFMRPQRRAAPMALAVLAGAALTVAAGLLVPKAIELYRGPDYSAYNIDMQCPFEFDALSDKERRAAQACKDRRNKAVKSAFQDLGILTE